MGLGLDEKKLSFLGRAQILLLGAQNPLLNLPDGKEMWKKPS